MLLIRAKRLTGSEILFFLTDLKRDNDDSELCIHGGTIKLVDLEERNAEAAICQGQVWTRQNSRTLDIFLQRTGICWKPGEGL